MDRRCIGLQYSSKFWASEKVIQGGYWVTSWVALHQRVLSSLSASPMVQLSKSDSEGSMVSNLTDDNGYVLCGLWKGEDEGAFGKDVNMNSGLFHKGLPCGSIFSKVREDDGA